MTPYQAAAFAYPCTVEGDLNRPNAGSAEQLAQVGPGAPVAPVSHFERGFRVTMIVDALPSSAGVAEHWPAWHISVALEGALSNPHRAEKGKAHQERALGAWGGLRARQAMHIIQRELRAVGDPGSVVLVDKPAALKMFAEQQQRASAKGNPGLVMPPVCVFGRKKMTLEEACRCLKAADDLAVLAVLDPAGSLQRELATERQRTGFDL